MFHAPTSSVHTRQLRVFIQYKVASADAMLLPPVAGNVYLDDNFPDLPYIKTARCGPYYLLSSCHRSLYPYVYALS